MGGGVTYASKVECPAKIKGSPLFGNEGRDFEASNESQK